MVDLKNNICVKPSMSPKAYKVINTHYIEIYGWTIITWILHAYGTHLGGINSNVQSDLSTLESNNGEQIEYFNRIIIILQQEINIYGEIVSHKIILLRYMKAFSKCHKRKEFIVPKMTYIITFLDKYGNWLSTQEIILMDSIVTYKWLDLQLTWPLQVGTLIILVLHLTPTMIHKTPSQEFQLSVVNIRLFDNYVEVFETSMMAVLFLYLNYSPNLRIKVNFFKTLHSDERTDTPIKRYS